MYITNAQCFGATHHPTIPGFFNDGVCFLGYSDIPVTLWKPVFGLRKKLGLRNHPLTRPHTTAEPFDALEPFGNLRSRESNRVGPEIRR